MIFVLLCSELFFFLSFYYLYCLCLPLILVNKVDDMLLLLFDTRGPRSANDLSPARVLLQLLESACNAHRNEGFSTNIKHYSPRRGIRHAHKPSIANGGRSFWRVIALRTMPGRCSREQLSITRPSDTTVCWITAVHVPSLETSTILAHKTIFVPAHSSDFHHKSWTFSLSLSCMSAFSPFKCF